MLKIFEIERGHVGPCGPRDNQGIHVYAARGESDTQDLVFLRLTDHATDSCAIFVLHPEEAKELADEIHARADDAILGPVEDN